MMDLKNDSQIVRLVGFLILTTLHVSTNAFAGSGLSGDVIVEDEPASSFTSCLPSGAGSVDVKMGSAARPRSGDQLSIIEDDHLKNFGNECLLVSDLNLKLDAGLTVVPEGLGGSSLAFGYLMRCMGLAGCYSSDIGTSTSQECLAKLCECNKDIVKEGITCGGSSSGFDCEAIKAALAHGGGAEIAVQSFPGASGHAVQITDIDCDLAGGSLSGGRYRDPNEPDTKKAFVINNETGKLSKYSDGPIAGWKVTAQYTVEPN